MSRRDRCLCGHDWIKHVPKRGTLELVYPCTIDGCECEDVIAPGAWYAVGVAMRSCAVCRGRRNLHGHHVVPRQRCKRRATELGVEPDMLVWDHRNALPLCESCHFKHHSAHWRIPRALIPETAHEFAEQYDLAWSIERDYPEATEI